MTVVVRHSRRYDMAPQELSFPSFTSLDSWLADPAYYHWAFANGRCPFMGIVSSPLPLRNGQIILNHCWFTSFGRVRCYDTFAHDLATPVGLRSFAHSLTLPDLDCESFAGPRGSLLAWARAGTHAGAYPRASACTRLDAPVRGAGVAVEAPDGGRPCLRLPEATEAVARLLGANPAQWADGWCVRLEWDLSAPGSGDV